jgi:DNA-binding response OmpR family regulator
MFHARERAIGEGMSTATAPAPRILVIEDEHRLRAMLEKGLRRAGFEAIGVADGTSGISEATSGGALHVILLDLGLPDMDGLEVMRRLREHGLDTPVVVLSARDAVSDKEAALRGGANDYVTKPFSFGELVARIRRQLGGAGPGVEAASRAIPETPDSVPEADGINGVGAGARGRALVIESEYRLGSFLRDGLAAHGFEAVVAEDGDVGAVLATTEPFDVVVLDLGDPHDGGFGVLTLLRRQVPWLPVIVFTGQDDSELRRRAQAQGAAGFSSKALGSKDLRQVIEQVIEAGLTAGEP